MAEKRSLLVARRSAGSTAVAYFGPAGGDIDPVAMAILP